MKNTVTMEMLLQKIEQLSNTLDARPIAKKASEDGFLRFTEKEILKMPKSFRKTFRIQGCTVHVRKRTDGRYNCSYEIRYAKKPYDKHPISASGRTCEEAKARFIEKINNYCHADCKPSATPTNFDKFALYWFENFHKRTASAKYYKNNLALYKRHIQKELCNYSLTAVGPMQLQSLLDGCPGNGKTADDVHTVLKQILDCAVNHGVIRLNPILLCHHEQHETEHGVALTRDEERLLLDTFAATEYQLYFAVILYTGLRPNEYPTATLDGRFIKDVKSKRHNSKGKIYYKRIPITPMLRPYLQGVTDLKLPRSHIIEHRFKKVFPDHCLKDMRTTFQTRCDQCKIPDKVIGLFMGNSIGGNLKEAYTDTENADYLNYLYEEGQKLNY